MPARASKPPHPEKPPKRPRDVNARAHQIVGELTGTAPPAEPERPKNPHAVALSKLGASKGGKARAAKLSSEQRSEIARHAAFVRYGRIKKKAEVE